MPIEPFVRVPSRPPRVAGFSYVGLYLYFLTICCDQRRRCFEDYDAANWLVSQIVQLFPSKQFAVIAYCVMLDHVHLLVEELTDDADLRGAMHAWTQRTGSRGRGALDNDSGRPVTTTSFVMRTRFRRS
jgi:REP element-mobilizing transposase RayT